MSVSAHNPYDEPESSSLKLFGNFLLLSLLAHAILVVLLLLLAVLRHPDEKPLEKENPVVSLSLVPPPKPIFIPTTKDPKAPHKQQQVESANDHELTTKSQVARAPDSFMPDVTGKTKATSLNDAPKINSPKPEVSSTPPTPRTVKADKPTPPQPPAPPTPQPQPKPAPQVAKPTPPKPPQPQVDDNGLPVLPPIAAQTMAQANPALAAQPLTPPRVNPQVAASVHGSLGRAGDNSPAAMATELGKYKQKVYATVGTIWYPDIDKHFGIIPVGIVRIRYTIHSDGTLTDVVVTEGDNTNLEQLKFISKNALVSSAPFDKFSDNMIKEVGDSYTDEFSFSVY